MALLDVQRISKRFRGVQAVSEVSFELAPGEILALIGPNGAGKSTCFNMLSGQLTPDQGSILLNGHKISGTRSRDIWRLGVGRTFQVATNFSSMTVIENVQVALISHHQRAWSIWPKVSGLYLEEAMALLERVGIAEQAQRPCGALAYGDGKRVDLAVGLASDPQILLMDEPTAGMASKERFALMNLITEIVPERGISVLFTEHDMDVVFKHADRLIVLHRGKIIAQGCPQQVREDRQVRDVYLGEVEF